MNYNISYNNIPLLEVKYKKGIIKVGKITNSEDCAKIMRDMFNADTIEYLEESIVIYMDFGNNVICYDKLSSGGISGTVIDRRVLFGRALKINATAMIIAHNHPSGNLTPSSEDIKLTKELVEIGKLHQIRVLDHLIITQEGYYSMADSGEIWQ